MDVTHSVILAQATEIMTLFRELNQKDGVTIVQVTHSEANAEYGNRVLRLKDGWLETEKMDAGGLVNLQGL